MYNEYYDTFLFETWLMIDISDVVFINSCENNFRIIFKYTVKQHLK